MNGNPKNLWAGEGRVNSTINTSSRHIGNAAEEVTNSENLEALATKWEKKLPGGEANKDGKIYLIGLRIAAGIARECLKNEEIPKEKKVGVFKTRIRDWLTSNYEIDLLGMLDSRQEKTDEQVNALPINRKYPSLKDTINTIHDILEEKKGDKDEERVKLAVGDLMTL